MTDDKKKNFRLILEALENENDIMMEILTHMSKISDMLQERNKCLIDISKTLETIVKEENVAEN